MMLALSAPAFAQSKADEARATALKKEGDELVHASKFREALEKYDASLALVPNPAIHYNRARALESLGDFPAALDAFDQFVATAPPELKSRVPHLDEMIAKVAAHVATLTIHCEVAGAAVTLRGKSVGATPLAPIHTAGGEANVTVNAPGYVAYSHDMTLTAGQSETLDVTLRKAAAAEPAGKTPEPSPFEAATPQEAQPKEAPARGGGGVRALAWISGGVGLASLGAGMAFLGASLGQKSDADAHCPNKLCDATGLESIQHAWTYADLSTVFVVVSVVALGTSVVSFLLVPKRAPVQARVFVGPTSVGVGGTF